MLGFGHDLRYAFRLMQRRPGVTAAAVLTFALGIGANTAIVSAINSVLLKPLPYRSADRLIFVSLALNTGFGERTSLPMADFLAWRASNHACATVAAYTGAQTVAVSNAGEAEAVLATSATAQFFETLGVKAAVGRLWRIGDDEPGAPATVVVSCGYWTPRLNSDPRAIGRTLTIEGQPFTIIGVAPEGFAFPSRRGQLWTILPATPPTRRGPFFLLGLGLMKPDARIELVQADLANADREVRQQFPRRTAAKSRVEFLKDVITGDVRSAPMLLLGAVIVVLLVAIVNVANLLLARAAEREREIAVRAALGAARARILRQLVIEGLALALVGAIAGMALAIWATRALVAAAPARLPRVAEIQMDFRVLAFTLLTAIVSGVLFALSPAWHLSTSTFAAAIPGIAGASVTTSLPPDGLSETDSFVVEDRLPPPDHGAPVGPILSIGDEYFRVIGTRLLKGREFSERDNATSQRVAIVSASLVRQHFGELDPIDRRIKQVADWPKPDTNPWLTIVGVVDDVKYAGLAETTGPALYVPLRQLPFRNQNLVIRVSGDASAAVTGIRAALKTLDPDLPLDDVQTMSDRLRTAAGQPRFRTWLIALFGAVALVLAAIGVYGVLNSSVAQRTREIGIRAALGATRPQLIAMVLRDSLALAGAGAIVGLALSVVTGRLISSMLFEVSPTDAATMAGATAILVSVAILSALLPARRAAAVDPSAAVRTE